MPIKFRGLWLRLKKWWRGYDILCFQFRSGNVIKMRVTDWKVTRKADGSGLSEYNITYHPTNRHRLLVTQMDQVECVFEVK